MSVARKRRQPKEPKPVQEHYNHLPPTVEVTLTQRHITLIRVALLTRCTKLKGLLSNGKQTPTSTAEIQASYNESIELLNNLHQLRLGST